MGNPAWEDFTIKVFSGSLIETLRIREDLTCSHCGRPFVGFRVPGAQRWPYCNPSHAAIVLQRQRDELLKQKREVDRIKREEERLKICPRPDKIAYRTADEADAAIKDTRAAGYTGSLNRYLCRCGALHIGNKSKTLTARIDRVERVRKATLESRRKRRR